MPKQTPLPSPVYESDLWWIFGLFIGSLPKARLSLTSTGRLTCALETGDVLFSAPVQNILYNYDTTTSAGNALQIVVADRRYDIQMFDSRTKSAFSGTVIDTTTKNKNARALGLAWISQLDAAKSLPADMNPIIAMQQEPRFKQWKAMTAVSLVVAIAWPLLIVAGLAWYSNSEGKDFNSTQIWAYLFAFVSFPVIYAVLRMYKQRVAARLHTSSPQNPQSVLPAGTMPSVKLPASTISWTIVGSFGVVIVLLIIFVILVQVTSK